MTNEAMNEKSGIVRRATRQANVDGILIGGGAPVVVQAMTNTDTADIAGTVAQAKALAEAGSELVRITVNTAEAAAAVAAIREQLDAADCHVPLIGDFHYNGHKLLADYRSARERSPSTGSTRATSARDRSAIRSSR